MIQPITIGKNQIGPGCAPYIIAELSANHNGDLSRALELMDAAYESGASAVKLQTYTADSMTIESDRAEFRIYGGLWDGRTLYDLYTEASMPWDWHESLMEKGRKLGIDVFSTPFDPTAVDFLETLEAPAYKVASFEATDIPLIKKIAETGKPMIISTGMANMIEIRDLKQAAMEGGCKELALLHCVSAYPAPVDQANLKTITDMQERFGLPIGLSDHTLGFSTAIAAISLGACIIEKHMTLRRSEGGVDSAFSMEPEEFKSLVDGVKEAYQAIGKVTYNRVESEKQNLAFRRSIVVVNNVAAGEVLTPNNLRIIRPGYGLDPVCIEQVLGRRASRSLTKGEPLAWNMIMSEDNN